MIQKKTTQTNGSRPARSRNNAERKRAEEALRRSDATYRAIFNAVNEGILVLDMETGEITDANATFCNVLGYRPEEVRQRRVEDVSSSQAPYIQESALRLIHEAASGEPQHFEWLAKSRDGRLLWIDVTLKRATIAGQDRVLAVGRDITERKRAEENLRQLESEKATILDSMSEVVVHLDPQLRRVWANKAAAESMSLTAAEAAGRHCYEIWRRRSEPCPGCPTTKARETGQAQEGEIVSRDGRVWFMKATPLLGADGRLEGIVEVASDITERKHTEEALRASEETYRSIFNATNDSIVIHDMETGEIVDANAAFQDRHGCTTQEARQLNVVPLGSGEAPYTQDDALRWIHKAARGQPQRFEWLAKDRNNKRLWIEVTLKRATIAGQDRVLAISRDITERKRAEDALRESEDKFRKLAETEAAAIFIYRGMKPLYMNTAMERLTGYTREEILARELWQFVHPDFQSVAKERSRACQQGEEGPSRYEFKIVTKSGEERWVDFTTGIIEFEGQPAVIGTAYDITERKQAEEALRESEQRYRPLVENVTDVIWTADMDLNFTYISPSFHLLGRAPGEPMPQRVEEMLTPASFEIAMKALAEELAIENMDEKDLSRSRTLELENHRGDGSTVWVENKMTFLRGPDGRPVGILGVTRDITERKRAEEALRESEARFRTLMETTAASVFIYRGTRPLYINAAMERLTGYTREEILARELWQLVHPDFQSLVRERSRARQQGEQAPSRYEFKIVTKSGDERWVDFTAGIIELKGQPAAIGTFYDITERKRAEEALRDAKEFSEGLLAAMQDGLSVLDSRGVSVHVNPAFCKMTGFSREEIVGVGPPRPYWPDEEMEEIERALQKVLSGQPQDHELTFARKNGERFPVIVSPSYTRDPQGNVVHRFATFKDITERKQAEQALRESERRFRTLSESSFEGIAIHRKGTILEANQALAAMFGYALSELMGMHVLDLTAPESRDLVAQNILSGYQERYEFTGLRKDGSTYPAEVCGKAISYQGRAARVAAVRDVTERKRMEEALENAREELEARVERQMERGNAYGLTFRELTVLHVVAAGRADKEIASQLGITTLTASKHLTNILSKMGATSRTEACVRALREGLLD